MKVLRSEGASLKEQNRAAVLQSPSRAIFSRAARRVLPASLMLTLALLLAPATYTQDRSNSGTNSAAAEKALKNDAPLPQDVLDVARDYEAPSKPLPPIERVGVDSSDPLPITLQEAIRLALNNNNDIEAAHIDVEMAEHNLNAARGAFDPLVSSETYFERSKRAVATFFGGSNNGTVKETDLTNRFSISGLSPLAGGSYKFEFSTSRLSSNNFFNSLDPIVSTGFSFEYTQPLLRGRRTDDSRRQVEISKRNLSLTDVQFRQRAIEIITRVEHAYWELVYALRNLQVQTDAVKQTRAQVETNRRQVQQGVLAPIDVVEAEAQVKNFEQNVYDAQEQVTRAENNLKTLLLSDRRANVWSRALLPITPVSLEAPMLVLQEAVSTALANRLELAELRTSADINQINKDYYRDLTKPQVDLTLGYSSNGLAGTVTESERNPLLTGVTSLQERVAELSALAGLSPLQAPPLSSVPADLKGGYGQSLANLLSQENPTVRIGLRISLPLKNRTAKARLGYSLAEGRRIDTLTAKTEQMIEAEVRNTMQHVRSVEARLAAAAAARTAAEQQYTSEQRKFEGGMSTMFLVLQRHTDLITARGRELQTQTELNKALADFQRAMGNTFKYRSVTVLENNSSTKLSGL